MTCKRADRQGYGKEGTRAAEGLLPAFFFLSLWTQGSASVPLRPARGALQCTRVRSGVQGEPQ